MFFFHISYLFKRNLKGYMKKNILAENMLRFGPKNLSESDRRRLQRLTEAEELTNQTLDTTALNTALKDLNGLLKTIPTTNKEPNSYDQYVTRGYFLTLTNDWNATYNGDLDTDLKLIDKGVDPITKKDPYTAADTSIPRGSLESEGITQIPAQWTALVLQKNDPANAMNSNRIAQNIVVAWPGDTEPVKNFIDKNVTDFNDAIGGLHKKDQEIARTVAAQLPTKLKAVSDAMVGVMSQIPTQKVPDGASWRSLDDIRKLVMTTTSSGYELELQLQGGLYSGKSIPGH